MKLTSSSESQAHQASVPAGATPQGPETDLQRAVGIYIAGGLVFSGVDAFAKAVTVTIPVLDLIWARSIVFITLLVVLAGRTRPLRLVRSGSPGLQVARALALFVATVTFFFSLAVLPLGEVTALGSASPLIVVALAGPVLHEQVSRPALVGAFVGFAGVVILIGLDPGGFDSRALLPLGTAVSYAAFSLLSRAVRQDPEEVTLFYTGALAALLATITLVVLRPPAPVSSANWIAAGLVGVGSLAGHRLLVTAYRRGEASDLAPFGYLGLVWSFLLGAVVFNEPIELRAVLGALAISFGGLIAIRGVADKAPEAALAVQPGRDVAIDEELTGS